MRPVLILEYDPHVALLAQEVLKQRARLENPIHVTTNGWRLASAPIDHS